MRKLYILFLAMLAGMVLSTGIAQAQQTYAITDYLVRTTTGSGSSYQEISGGTELTQLEQTYYYGLGLMTSPIQMPFNFRFLNTQLTTSNTFEVNGYGSIIMSPTWVSGTNNYPDYEASQAYGYEYNYGSYASSYDLPYEFADPEYDYGSYGYYPNYKVVAFEGYNYQYPSVKLGSFSYAVLGSAPNRQLVVQSKDIYGGYYYYAPTLKGNWQTVIFENGISKFQLNYGAESGSFGATSYDNAWFIGSYVNYGSYTYGSTNGDGGVAGIKVIGGTYLTLGWDGYGSNPNNDSYPANTDGTGINPKWAYNVYGGHAQYYLNSAGVKTAETYGGSTLNSWKHLPATSYMIFIAWPSDFSADIITSPADQSIKLKDNPVPLAVQITNQGTTTPTSVTVRFQVSPYGGSGPVYTHDTVLTGSQIPNPFTSKTINFPSYTPTSYGIYEDTVFVFGLQPTADQSPADNVTHNEFTVSPPNNVRTLTVLSPAPGTRTPIAIETPVSVRFKNVGANDQTNVRVSAVIKDPSGAVVYRDSVTIANWPSGMSYDTTFKNWIPAVNGPHTVCGITLMISDQLHADDTACSPSLVAYESDVAAIAVVNPQPDQEEVVGHSWKPAALFQSVGVADLFDVPVQLQIHRCSDGVLVFKADSIVPELNVDQNQVRFEFPSKKSIYDVTKLPAGCYTICAIAKYLTDGDRSNDTACSTFSIIPNLHGDYYVGVGQHFQTIHAALDSARYRGILGNVRFILTDNSYSENGSYRVSDNLAALDFGGITGLGPNATITWLPKPGVTPTITFTGNRPFCFYFGDLSGYINFEGYNPLGAPIPDKLVGEPNKRTMTIIDNSTAAGGIFAVEEGASSMTFKDLRLIGNGMFSNDSDAVVRIYNEQSRNVYVQRHILDTIAIHNVVVSNCELGNAKYGIWDHAMHPELNIFAGHFQDWRNYNNVFTRNTIGSSTYPLSMAGVYFNNEQNLTISHNEISNINGSLGGFSNVYGVYQPSVLQGDTGNVVGVWVDANRIRNLAASGATYGIAFQQAATVYTAGTGSNAVHSILPTTTANRTTNNMIFDLRGQTANYPLMYTTAAATYSTDRDSIFNNSISTKNATVNVFVAQTKHVFLWNNAIQNTGAGPYTNYSLQVPRPFVSAISSDYNLFDLRGTSTFASVNEYDLASGTAIQTRTFRHLNDWQSYMMQDAHSLSGDPMFAADSLHMPGALSYIESPSSNNGAWLGSASMVRDFDGDLRLQGNQTPDIGADEFEGFQYTNDLSVQDIVAPGGYSATSDTVTVTFENPLSITALVKNLSSQAVFNVPVTAKVEVSLSGLAYSTIYTHSTSPENFDVNEAKTITWQGPTITAAQAQNGVFRVTVSVPNDQYNANNVKQKVFRVLLKTNATLVSYTSGSTMGIRNLDSVTAALRNLGVPYDSLDRTVFSSTDIDYAPYWTLIWAAGDPSEALQTTYVGSGALSFKETQDVERFLQAGQTYGKKSLIMAGQNIAFYNAFVHTNNSITDPEFMTSYMHTTYKANSPTGGAYAGWIKGLFSDYNNSADSLNSGSPDVVAPSFTTPLIGSEVTGFAYSYLTHPSTPADSGAGTTYLNPTINTVFYGFDWSDPVQTPVSGPYNPALTSGTTRILKGALDFVRSHSGTILPVEFTDVQAHRINGNGFITWATAHQKDVAQFVIESRENDTWTAIGTTNADKYSFTQAGIDPAKTYTYRIAAVDLSGAKTYSNEVEMGPDNSLGFTLGQNYPNPASAMTSIQFTLPVNAVVSLRILDVTGKVVSNEITNQEMGAGTQSYTFDGSKLSSGSYIYELTAVQPNGQTVTLTKKMTLDK
jgi:hypothetical protein